MKSLSSSSRERSGFSIVEVMLVIVLMSLITGFMLISSQTAGSHILEESTAVLAADLMLARDTAFTYGTDFTVAFDSDNNRYTVSHSGSGQTPPFERPLGNGIQGNFTVYISRIHPDPNTRSNVSLYRVRTASTNQDVTNVTFNSLGNTGPVRTEDTCIWLTEGTGSSVKYQKITISWLTGQVWTAPIASAP